jgi:hypothetical protein
MTDIEHDVNEAPEPSGKATASMICGIVSLLGACFLGPFMIPVAIVGLVLGIMSIKAANKGFAITGIATSAISLLLVILAVAGLAFLTAQVDGMDEFRAISIDPEISAPPEGIFEDPPEDR